jgi:hypothetical protein
MSQSLLFGVLGLILGGALVAVVMMARQSRLISEGAALAAQLASERRSAEGTSRADHTLADATAGDICVAVTGCAPRESPGLPS